MTRERPLETHHHGWAVVDFFVEADRPMMRQACVCGTTREIRAFDVTWNPPINEGDAQPASPEEDGGRGTTMSRPAAPGT